MTLTVELTREQVLRAIRQLPFEERLSLLQTLIEDDKEAIGLQFDRALAQVHQANSGLNEDDVMAEVDQLVHQVRAERYATDRR